MKKALILDLDNTIYPVSSIADALFESLFNVVEEYRELLGDEKLQHIKYEFTRRPYQHIAADYNFSPELCQKGLDYLQNITYNKPMVPYNGYRELSQVPITKFLVTTGFTKLQNSKVKMLDIENDFAEIHIVDPQISTITKKDVFADILQRHDLLPDEVLVIGDDPQSEIKAAQALGIDTFLFDPENKHPEASVTYKSVRLVDVLNYL